MAERSTYDAMMDLLGMRGQAEAAPWNEVVKIFTKLAPKGLKDLSAQDRATLEIFNELYPAVRKVGATGGYLEHYMPPKVLGSVSDYAAGRNIGGYGNIHIAEPMGFAHEGSHVFTGPLHDWAGTGLGKHGVPRGVLEGFAEGNANAMLNRYNKLADAPYWPDWYRSAEDRLRESYLKAGYIGADVGATTRAGRKVDQKSIIDELLGLIEQYRFKK